MVTFVGAGPGAKDLITVRGQRLLEEADIVIYAGSLVNPKLLYGCKETCAVYNSAKMTLEEVLEVIKEGETQRKNIVRLHTGDPCLYGAIKEQMDELERLGIGYEVCPGVSSFCAAAAALDAGIYTSGSFKSVVITRMAGRRRFLKGVDQKFCGSWHNNGYFFKHRDAKRTFRRADQRRI